MEPEELENTPGSVGPEGMSDWSDEVEGDGWYFDLPDGAWERQEQKNRELRENVRQNIRRQDGADAVTENRDPFRTRPEQQSGGWTLDPGAAPAGADEPWSPPPLSPRSRREESPGESFGWGAAPQEQPRPPAPPPSIEARPAMPAAGRQAKPQGPPQPFAEPTVEFVARGTEEPGPADEATGAAAETDVLGGLRAWSQGARSERRRILMRDPAESVNPAHREGRWNFNDRPVAPAAPVRGRDSGAAAHQPPASVPAIENTWISPPEQAPLVQVPAEGPRDAAAPAASAASTASTALIDAVIDASIDEVEPALALPSVPFVNAVDAIPLRRRAEAEEATNAPETERAPSRWDEMFAEPAGDSIVDAMRAWQDQVKEEEARARDVTLLPPELLEPFDWEQSAGSQAPVASTPQPPPAEAIDGDDGQPADAMAELTPGEAAAFSDLGIVLTQSAEPASPSAFPASAWEPALAGESDAAARDGRDAPVREPLAWDQAPPPPANLEERIAPPLREPAAWDADPPLPSASPAAWRTPGRDPATGWPVPADEHLPDLPEAEPVLIGASDWGEDAVVAHPEPLLDEVVFAATDWSGFGEDGQPPPAPAATDGNAKKTGRLSRLFSRHHDDEWTAPEDEWAAPVRGRAPAAAAWDAGLETVPPTPSKGPNATTSDWATINPTVAGGYDELLPDEPVGSWDMLKGARGENAHPAAHAWSPQAEELEPVPSIDEDTGRLVYELPRRFEAPSDWRDDWLESETRELAQRADPGDSAIDPETPSAAPDKEPVNDTDRVADTAVFRVHPEEQAGAGDAAGLATAPPEEMSKPSIAATDPWAAFLLAQDAGSAPSPITSDREVRRAG